jgi:hypothetical protein
MTTEQTANEGLATLNPDGRPPESRMTDAMQARGMVKRMLDDDEQRNRKRALVKGLVDGNPPYQASKLRDANRADACNVNWGIARSYLESASGAFYDIFNEAPTYATVTVLHGTAEQRAEWSQIVTEEFDKLQKDDTSFDPMMQNSQLDMVLFGCGPLVFEDPTDWHAKSAHCGELFTPERAKADTSRWELAVVILDYLPHELYDKIRDEKIARRVGWNVEAVKNAIINACTLTSSGGDYLTWEWHQQMLKNNSYAYDSISKRVKIAHLYFREFPQEGQVEGRVTHKQVLADDMATTTKAPGAKAGNGEVFLYERVGRYANFREVVHPMYYDQSGGGEHHSITGMGVKMYSAMEYQNRLLCNLADKAFAPKVVFKPTTDADTQMFEMAKFGDFGVIPAGFEYQQTATAGIMEEGMAFDQKVTNLLASNLSQYRQNLAEKGGNPITAREAVIKASQSSALAKTQLNRYYAQLDGFYQERYRRASNPNLQRWQRGAREALDFQQECAKRGVPKEALMRAKVSASRVVGQGSAYMRLEALLGLFTTVFGRLPETGQTHLVNDIISAQAGQSAVNRYNPAPQKMMGTDQEAFASVQIGAMKDGIPPVISPTQNPMVFATSFMAACGQALESLQAGANPMEVIAFVDVAAPAALSHIQRMASDPTRQNEVKALLQQWKQLASTIDQLKKQVQQQQEQQRQQQAKMAAKAAQAAGDAIKAGLDGSAKAEAERVAIEGRTADAELSMAQQEQQAKLQMQAEQHKQSMAIADAKAADEIRRKNANDAAKRENEKKMTEAKAKAAGQAKKEKD